MGATGVSRGQLDYTYAKVDKDATLAAYNTDDFFWGTGWEGHRVDLGLTTKQEQLDPRRSPSGSASRTAPTRSCGSSG